MKIDFQERGIVASLVARGTRHLPTHVISNGFHSLKVRNFRLFIGGQIVSLSGTWMQTTAQAWLVLQLSNSPLALGVVTTLQFLPVMLLSLYGGVLADRLPKRRTLIATQSLLLVQALIFGILVATNAIQLWHIYLLAVSQGIVQAIDTPVRQAFVVEMVGREELVNAVALNSMTFNGARIIGPAVAGFVIAQIGIAPTLFVNAISYVAVIIALLMMREQDLFNVAIASAGSQWTRLKEGLAFTWHTPKVLVIIIMLAAIGTFGYNFTILLPLIANYVLKVDAQGFGLLSSIFGLGSLVAAFGSAYIKRPQLRYLFIAAGVFSVLLGLTAITPVFAISGLLFAGMGMAGIFFATGVNSLMQLNTPDALRGRVMSLNVLLVIGSTPIGALLIGLLSDHLGVQVAIVTCATLCSLGVLIALVYKRRHPEANEAPGIMSESAA